MNKRKYVRIHITLDEDIKTEIERLAKDERRPMSTYIQMLCDDHIKTLKKDGLVG